MVLKGINIQIKSNVIRNIYEQHKTMIFTTTRTHTQTRVARELHMETLAGIKSGRNLNRYSCPATIIISN